MAIHFHSKNQSQVVPCYRGLNILAHAQIEEINIGSRCGGHGICGGDKIKITSEKGSLSPPTAAEKEHLSEEAIQAGWRLACQCWPADDSLSIHVQAGISHNE